MKFFSKPITIKIWQFLLIGFIVLIAGGFLATPSSTPEKSQVVETASYENWNKLKNVDDKLLDECSTSLDTVSKIFEAQEVRDIDLETEYIHNLLSQVERVTLLANERNAIIDKLEK